jgi:putative ABC transport system permease protein
LRSVDRLLDTDPGFDASGAMTAWVTLPASRYPEGSARLELWNGFLERVRALPGVQAAGAMTEVPLGGGNTNGGFQIVGRAFPDGEEPNVKKRFAGPGAFEALGVPLLRGRSFLDSDVVGSPEVAVVSRSFAERWWPGGDPIGQRIRFFWHTQGEQEIVGVVEDVRSEALDMAELGTVYLSYVQIPAAAPAMSVIVRTSGDPLALAEPVRGALQSIDRALPLSGVTTLDALVSRSISNRTRVMSLLATFAGVALALAALGLYAVTARAVGARSREIGIRKAMGAERASIIGMVLREEGPAVLLGLLVGLAASVPATRVLGGLLYATRAGDPTTLVAVTLTLATAALAALLAASWRAARTPPALAVRS